jgi:hypothetical protein
VADQHILRLMGALEWDKLDQWMKPSPVRILCLWPLLLLLMSLKKALSLSLLPFHQLVMNSFMGGFATTRLKTGRTRSVAGRREAGTGS